ncbi:hypothetical protein D3C75_1016470 [compost metagenome]
MFGVLRDFLDRGAHLVHGSGDLIGFLTLLADAQLGVLAAGSQLCGGLRQMANTLIDTADQLAQAQGHFLHAGLQLAHFVTTTHRLHLAQVTPGDARCHRQGLA